MIGNHIGIEAQTIGELTRSKAKHEKLVGQLDGCQWARTCDRCPWVDCYVMDYGSNRYAFKSKQAKAMRLYEAVRTVQNTGATVKEIAKKFCLHERSIRRYLVEHQGLTKIHRQIRNEVIRQEAKKGIPVFRLARRFNIKSCTVRRILKQPDHE